MNGGTCENGAPRAGFTCTCPHGYSGDSCEFACASNSRPFSVNETTEICVPEHLYPSADVFRCSLEKTWQDIRDDRQASDATGKGVQTGGLGRKMVNNEWEVWVCYPELTCGALVGSDAVCFTFSERFHVFVPWGRMVQTVL